METLLIGTMIMGAVGTIAQGAMKFSEASQERQAAETNASLAEVNALNQENDRRSRLMKTLSAQRAQAAAMGLDVTRSGSLLQIQRADTEEADREIDLIKLNKKIAVAGYRQQAGNAAIAGPFALGSSILQAAGSIGGGIMRFNQIGGSAAEATTAKGG